MLDLKLLKQLEENLREALSTLGLENSFLENMKNVTYKKFLISMTLV